MTDLRIPTGTDPWAEFPAIVERLRNVALDHQEREEDCGDHRIETCSCGVSGGSATMPSEVFAQGPEARTEFRNQQLSLGHSWRWRDHFTEEWNRALGGET